MKKMNIRLICVLAGLLFLAAACQKEDIPVYTGDNRVNFDYNAMSVPSKDGRYLDTLVYELGFSDTDSVQVDLEFILIGYAADHDREIALNVTGDTEFVGSVLAMPETIVMPAGEVSTTVPVYIVVSEDLREDAKMFHLTIADGEELLAGNRTTLSFQASADVPTEWVGGEGWMDGYRIEDYFGECSQTKYLFVYEVLGIWDFTDWGTWGIMANEALFAPAARVLKERLAEYEAENGLMIDENGNRVTFP